MKPEDLSEALRNTTDDTMRGRRGVVGLALAAVGSMELIAVAATFATAPLVAGEAREALSALAERSGARAMRGAATHA